MQLLAASTFAILAGLVAGSAPCPTVTTTAERCSTCVVPACLAISTVHVPSGCGVATSTVSYPCAEGNCPKGCASTSYVYSLDWHDPTGAPPQPTATDGPACRPN
ncbi:hypothetical protein ISF_00601 [Cordyceps fumosorosea ARSEF 2679]|uniref:Uncharacterized protein n=1 Tax=Cordyceps fumosorosea (strain ARSEF 2679) TaxID=1081104 RepID=A0A168EE16_CORFA|nr:hypothetical protein ISF_00601 [Cordyceps fumosorosea ARSEF 2679]OAA73700.1 hypothetical protein ISF_00601 [Cordyceps fumosorosea ARSEF 2679]